MSVEFWIIAWLYAMQFPDGRVQRYQFTFNDRFKTVMECEALKKTLVNRYPRENNIDTDGSEMRFSDHYCLEIKRPEGGAFDAYAVSRPPINPPLPPRRPAGI
jgi:hypothetical protein